MLMHKTVHHYNSVYTPIQMLSINTFYAVSCTSVHSLATSSVIQLVVSSAHLQGILCSSLQLVLYLVTSQCITTTPRVYNRERDILLTTRSMHFVFAYMTALMPIVDANTDMHTHMYLPPPDIRCLLHEILSSQM